MDLSAKMATVGAQHNIKTKGNLTLSGCILVEILFKFFLHLGCRVGSVVLVDLLTARFSAGLFRLSFGRWRWRVFLHHATTASHFDTARIGLFGEKEKENGR